MTNTQPLPLPDDFNPQTFLRLKTTEYGTFHESRKGAQLAEQLVANGTPPDIELAEKVLEATLACQERDSGDPHYGNFYWMAEDDLVEDLNAVEFVLESLIPMMLQHRARLSETMQQRILDAIRLGLTAIERLDVLVVYTNITTLDILNTCLGGELLNDSRLAKRGYRKLQDWIAFTHQSGHPFEFNSPTYIRVTIRALKQLADLVQDEATRLRAKAQAGRLALSVAMHLHSGTGRWAGPHSRAYHPSVVCETPPEINTMRTWLADGTVPAWIGHVLDQRPAEFQVTETASREQGIGLSTYHAPSFALGVATRAMHNQANVCLLHYRRPKAERPGVMYTRYIVDDKWFGDSYHATDRTKTRNLLDEGEFYGVQHGQRAIGVYSPLSFREGSSAKATLIWTGRDQIDEIWIDDQRVEQLPVELPADALILLASGDVYMAIRPLMATALGKETPIKLVEREGDLVLEMFNYQGQFKRFWELRWPGPFYQGRPFCAYYLEVAERSADSTAQDFAETVKAGHFSQQLDPAFTYLAEGERLYTAAYQRNGQDVGLAVDTMAWQLKRRWIETGDFDWPMLASSFAAQNSDGRIEVGETVLTCDAQPAWLVALPNTGRYIVGYLGAEPTDLTLRTPAHIVRVKGMGMGLMVLENDQVTVEAVGNPTVKVMPHFGK